MQMRFFFGYIYYRNNTLGNSCRKRPDCRAFGAEPGRTEFSINQNVINTAVDRQCGQRQIKSNSHNLYTAQCCQQYCRYRKKEVSKADNRQIADTFFNNCLIFCKKPDRFIRKQTDRQKEHCPNGKRRMHRNCRNFFNRSCFILPPVLAAENDHTVSCRH